MVAWEFCPDCNKVVDEYESHCHWCFQKESQMNRVYLAGPITNLSYGDATSWREYVIKSLASENIRGISPLRCKEYLKKETSLEVKYDEYILSTGKGITTRDKWDCHRCDALLVNLLGSEKVSIGTMMELGWANSAGKPIVLVMEDGNIHDHAMVREVCGFITHDLLEGIKVIKALFAGEK